MSALAHQQGVVAAGSPSGSASMPFVVGRTAFAQNTSTSIGINFGAPKVGNLLIAVFAADMELAPSQSGWTKLVGKAALIDERRLALQVFAKLAVAGNNAVSIENQPPWVPVESAAVGFEIAGPTAVAKAIADIQQFGSGTAFASPPLVVDGSGPALWLSVAAWKSVDRNVESKIVDYPGNMPKGNRSISSSYVSGQYASMPGIACAEVATDGAMFQPQAFTTDNADALAVAAIIGIRT